MSVKYRETDEDKKLRNWFLNDFSCALLRNISLEKRPHEGFDKIFNGDSVLHCRHRRKKW